MWILGRFLGEILTLFIDFSSFEVKRSLVACDGAILLVAANQGVQAQTIFNFWTAFEANLTILPVINKVIFI
jgi:translation elongation factor EF-4